jgi:hypothetical protein
MAPRNPRPGARRWFLLAGAVIVLAGIVIPRIGGDRGTPGAPPSPGTTSPASGPALAGVPAAAPLGFRLLVAGGPRLLAVTAGGAVDEVTLPGLESSHVVRELLRVENGTAIVAGPVDGGPGQLYFLPDGAAQPAPLDPADSVVATSQPGRLYTVTWKHGTAELAEIDLNGQQSWSRRLPRTVRVVRGVAGGLLIRYDKDPDVFGEELRVVDPRSGRVLRRLGLVGQVVAAAVDHLVTTCDPRQLSSGLPCNLIIFDLRSGVRREYALPDERRGPGPGILSPDGQLLALSSPGFFPAQLDDPVGTFEQLRSGVVHVLDLRTGAWTQVPGVMTSPTEAPLMAWSPSGAWLALGVYWPDHKRLAHWQVGAARLQLQRERLPGGWEQGVLPSGLVALSG